MEKFIEEQLRKMRSIKADNAYFERSFQEITAANQSSGLISIFSSKISYSVAGLALAVFIVFMSVNSSNVPSGPNTSVASLSGEDLNVEASDEDFQIHVQEASYFSESAAKVASALDEIASE
ncbi:MAG: hypothetical protein Q8Q32_01875 [bacterium]|nr:hypothetical protein [bacterium]